MSARAFATESFRVGKAAILFFLIGGLVVLWGVRYDQSRLAPHH